MNVAQLSTRALQSLKITTRADKYISEREVGRARQPYITALDSAYCATQSRNNWTLPQRGARVPLFCMRRRMCVCVFAVVCALARTVAVCLRAVIIDVGTLARGFLAGN